MSLKDKIMNKLVKYPGLITLSIDLAITFIIGTAIGSLDYNQASAFGFHHIHHFGFG
jgi:hypothetical protein